MSFPGVPFGTEEDALAVEEEEVDELSVSLGVAGFSFSSMTFSFGAGHETCGTAVGHREASTISRTREALSSIAISANI